jgi:UDP-sugar diphosphatase
MIENINLQKTYDTHFVTPYLMHFEENGIPRTWEVIKAHDSVATLLYKEDTREFVLVKQFRPAVYLNNRDGYTIELCAGIMDKEKSFEETAVEEIEEETGYRVEAGELVRINSFYTSVGFAGAKQVLFFAKVSERHKVNGGGGIVGEENIEVWYLPVDNVKAFIYDESVAKTPGLIYAFYWFFDREEARRD